MNDQAAKVISSYCGPAPSPAELLSRWNFDPLLLGLIGVASIAVALVTGPVRKAPLSAAIIAFALLFLTPLCAVGSALFSARVAHHAVLVALIAPLFAYGLPRVQTPLITTTAFQAAVFWIWHIPGPYAAAMTSDAVFWLMQLSLLGSATLFWMAVRWSNKAGALVAILATMVQMGLLGALITFAGAQLYAPHSLTTAAWGLTPLEDQQLAGLIMWVPMSGVYLTLALVLTGRWLGSDPEASRLGRL